ncbi:hypothetical protein ACLRGF_08780 [Mycetocola zhadangensis]|uniref:hypothetical protein n=1 Tax=Mycetocola zhadangensis TaxID=1164595 RepID=UPI003A4E3885
MTFTEPALSIEAPGGSHKSVGGRVVAFTAIAAVLAGVIPVTLVAQVEDIGQSEAWMFTLAILIWGGLRLAWLIVAGVPRLFDFFFWMFSYIFMGIAPTVQIRSGLTSTTTPGVDEGLYVPTAILICVGLAAYEVARAAWIAWERSRARAEAGSVGEAFPTTEVDRTKTLLLVAFGLAASAYFLSAIGPVALLGSREAFFDARSAAWADPAVRSIMYALAIYPLLVGAGALAQLRRRAGRPSVARWYGAGLIGCVAVLLLIVNPVGSARYTLGTVVFALVVYAGAVTTPRRVRFTLASTLGAFLFLFPLADAFRNEEVRLTRNGFFGEYMSNPDYDAFWQVANAFSYWIDGLVQPLHQLSGSVFFWVPRALWPDKPTDTGILLANYRGYSMDNLSAPLWAELIVNGGVLALALGFVAVGIALRVMDTRLLASFSAGGFWAIVGAIFPVYMTILMRGSLLQATGAVAVALACVLLVRKRRPQPVVTSVQLE